jgi:hypothetical protein
VRPRETLLLLLLLLLPLTKTEGARRSLSASKVQWLMIATQKSEWTLLLKGVTYYSIQGEGGEGTELSLNTKKKWGVENL